MIEEKWKLTNTASEMRDQEKKLNASEHRNEQTNLKNELCNEPKCKWAGSAN